MDNVKQEIEPGPVLDPVVFAALSQALHVWVNENYLLDGLEVGEDFDGFGLFYRILYEMPSLISEIDSASFRIADAAEWISERESRRSR